MVVVRAAARGVHRRGRHGVEGEHELLAVTHARRLGMVPGNTCNDMVGRVLKKAEEVFYSLCATFMRVSR